MGRRYLPSVKAWLDSQLTRQWLTAVRFKLHETPDLSGREEATCELIRRESQSFIKRHADLKVCRPAVLPARRSMLNKS